MSVPLVAHVEAVLFLADQPVPLEGLVEATNADEESVKAALERLEEAYNDPTRGLVLQAAAGGWRLYTDPSVNESVERWALSGRTGRLTQAALETLAVIAYKQPITRLEISEVRGVQADAAVRSLEQRGLIEAVGVQDGPGQAALFGTTERFLETVAVDRLEDLPPLTDWLPEEAAPDEPAAGDLRAARTRLAAGEDLPSSWQSGAPTTDTPAPGTGEIEELTSALESAAADAVKRLRTIMATTDEEPEGADNGAEGGSDPPGVDGDQPSDAASVETPS